MKFLSKFFQEIGEHGTRTVVNYGTIMILGFISSQIHCRMHLIVTIILTNL